MDERIAAELRSALNYLRAGKTKDARPIILQILKTNPEVDQAWYMLSFVISDRDKQIYALQQVLNLNPNHDKAKNRLSKILSEPQEAGEVANTISPTPPNNALKDNSATLAEPVVDDWQSRLSTPEPSPPPKKVAPMIVKPVIAEPQANQNTEYEDDEPELGGITSDSFGKYAAPKKNFAKPIRRILFAIIILAALGFGALKGIEIIPGLIEGFVNSQPVVDDVPVEVLPTETPKSSGGRVLPPTWTPTFSPTSTMTPTITPTLTETEIPTS